MRWPERLECRAFDELSCRSVGESLGFEDKTEKIPDADTALLCPMCDHGMMRRLLANKMPCFVKENRRTPEQAAAVQSRLCSCAVFNSSRVKRILENAHSGHQM